MPATLAAIAAVLALLAIPAWATAAPQRASTARNSTHAKSHKRKHNHKHKRKHHHRRSRARCKNGKLVRGPRRRGHRRATRCVRPPKLAPAGKRTLQSMQLSLGVLGDASHGRLRGRHLSKHKLSALRRHAFSRQGAKAAAEALRRAGVAARASARSARKEGQKATSGHYGGWAYSTSFSGGQVAVQAARNIGGNLEKFTRSSSRLQQSVEPCPDVSGIVNGHERWRELTTASDHVQKGLTLKASVLAVVDVAAAGHVGDDAKLHSYDLRGAVQVTVRLGIYRGRHRVAWSPTKRDRFGFVQTLPANGDVSSLPNSGKDKISSAGSLTEMAAEAGYAQQLWQLTVDDLRVAFDTAEYNGPGASGRGWLEGGCVNLSVTPTVAELAPGQTTTVTATVKPVRGSAVAPGTFTAATSAGVISPASGTYQPGRPITLTFTAPQGGSARITVSTVSRQGTGTGATTVQVTSIVPREWVGTMSGYEIDPAGSERWDFHSDNVDLVLDPDESGDGVWQYDTVPSTTTEQATISGTGVYGCTVSGSGTAPNAGGALTISEQGMHYDAEIPFEIDSIQVTEACPGEPPETGPDSPPDFSTSDSEPYQFGQDTVSGTWDDPLSGAGVYHVTWSLTAKR